MSDESAAGWFPSKEWLEKTARRLRVVADLERKEHEGSEGRKRSEVLLEAASGLVGIARGGPGKACELLACGGPVPLGGWPSCGCNRFACRVATSGGVTTWECSCPCHAEAAAK